MSHVIRWRTALLHALWPLALAVDAAAQNPPAQAPPAGAPAPAPAAPEPAPGTPPAAPGPSPAATTTKAATSPATAPPSADADADAEIAAMQRAAEIEQSASSSEPKLQLYGFADFTYRRNLSPKSSFFYSRTPFDSFSIGNVNLYLDGSAGDSLRSLVEVRFLYLPNGSVAGFSDSGDVQWVDTSTPDYAEEERPLRWGGIELERVWVEYVFNNYIAVRAGQWLTPYGIWNVDHGSPTVIPITRPYIIGEELFPERQTGLELYGKVFVGATTLGYHATISNGRGPADSYRDKDSNKALGGRIYASARPFGELQIGASIYRGRYTEYKARLAATAGTPPSVTVERTPYVGIEELSMAADLRWQWEDLLVQAEVIANDRAFDDDARNYPTIAGQPPISNGTAPADYRRWGAYGLVGYRTPLYGIMPYTHVQYYNAAGNPNIPPIRVLTFGVNVRPMASLVLKAEYFTAKLGDSHSTELFRGTYSMLAGQVAWAF